MPFQSDAQRKFMYANHPEIAKKWEAETKAAQKSPWADVKMPGADDDKKKIQDAFNQAWKLKG